MRIVFFGNPDFCFHPLLSLYHSQHEIISVVTNTDSKSGRGLKLSSSFVKQKALELNIPIIETDNVNSDKLFNQLNDLKLPRCNSRYDLHLHEVIFVRN